MVRIFERISVSTGLLDTTLPKTKCLINLFSMYIKEWFLPVLAFFLIQKMNYVMAFDDHGKWSNFWNHPEFIMSLQMHLGHKNVMINQKLWLMSHNSDIDMNLDVLTVKFNVYFIAGPFSLPQIMFAVLFYYVCLGMWGRGWHVARNTHVCYICSYVAVRCLMW